MVLLLLWRYIEPQPPNPLLRPDSSRETLGILAPTANAYASIRLRLVFVTPAVELHDQLQFATAEIHNVRLYRLLPPKLQADQPRSRRTDQSSCSGGVARGGDRGRGRASSGAWGGASRALEYLLQLHAALTPGPSPVRAGEGRFARALFNPAHRCYGYVPLPVIPDLRHVLMRRPGRSNAGRPAARRRCSRSRCRPWPRRG